MKTHKITRVLFLIHLTTIIKEKVQLRKQLDNKWSRQHELDESLKFNLQVDMSHRKKTSNQDKNYYVKAPAENC